MDKQEAVQFLFGIAKEIKLSFENPIILLTFKDYAGTIYKSMINMRAAVLNNAEPETIADVVNHFHLEWLQAVQDIEDFRKSQSYEPKSTLIDAIDFTMACIENRLKYFKSFIEPLKSTMEPKERLMIQADIEVMRVMKETVNGILLGKQKCFSQITDETELRTKAALEIEELLNWLDQLNDNLAIQFSKIFSARAPELLNYLNDVNHQICEATYVGTSTDLKVIKHCLRKERHLSITYRASMCHDLEIQKVTEMINELEKRVTYLQKQNSSAAQALHHKTLYLMERLQSLEDLRKYLMTARSARKEKTKRTKSIAESKFHTFNHILPLDGRCQLIKKSLNIWFDAIYGDRVRKRRSTIVTISGTTELNERLSNYTGAFIINKFGRKLYRKEDDDVLYQKSENDELAPLKKDERHVYFYDEIGRYYLNETNQRIYKTSNSVSEYLLHRGGLLTKVKKRDGVQYCFDNLGMYFYSKTGKRIYIDNGEECEYDGIANIIRIRPETPSYEMCPIEPIVTEDSKYIKQTVGMALKQCILDVVLKKPSDPIKHLAESLTKYRHNIEDRQKRECEEREMIAARELYLSSIAVQESEHSYNAEREDSKGTVDLDFANYKTMEI